MDDLGQITACWSVSFERSIPHPPERLWSAITEPLKVGGWWGSCPTRIDLRVGGEWFVDFGGDRGELDGVIVRMEPNRRLALVWGRSVVEWELAPDEAGCRYTFVHHGQTPGLSPSEEGLAAGWHACLVALERTVDGQAFDAAADEALVRKLMPAYREQLQAVLG